MAIWCLRVVWNEDGELLNRELDQCGISEKLVTWCHSLLKWLVSELLRSILILPFFCEIQRMPLSNMNYSAFRFNKKASTLESVILLLRNTKISKVSLINGRHIQITLGWKRLVSKPPPSEGNQLKFQQHHVVWWSTGIGKPYQLVISLWRIRQQ